MRNHLHQRPGSSNYHFRRAVPKRLWALIGRREITHSLETPNRKEAERLARKRLVDTDALFAFHDEQLQALKPSASPETTPIKTAIQSEAATPVHLERWMIPRFVDRAKAALLCELHPIKDRETLRVERNTAANKVTRFRDAIPLREYEVIGELLRRLCDFERIDLAASPAENVEEFKEALLRTSLEAAEQQLSRLNGAKVVAPKFPNRPEVADNWDALLAHWNTRRKPVKKTFDETCEQVRRLRAFTGDLAPSSLTEDHAQAFAEYLQDDLKLTASRAKTILALVRAVVGVCLKSGDTALTSNPFESVEVVLPRFRASDDRQPFELEHLTALFNSPVYVDRVRPGKGGGEAAFWIPLMMLFSGARLEELCQLHLSDVQTIKGQMFLRIAAIADDQGVKNQVSVRKIPVHHELLRIGFANYVKSVQQNPEARLFPDLKRDPQYGKYSKVFSTWANEYIDKHVVDDPRYVCQSMRHVFQEHAGQSGLDYYQVTGIMGHQLEGMAARYGKKENGRRVFDPMILAEGMKLYAVEGLDLSHLHGAY